MRLLGIKFMVTVTELKYSLNVPNEILIEQRRLDRAFDTWLLRFEDVAKTLPPSNSVNLMVRSSFVLCTYSIRHDEQLPIQIDYAFQLQNLHYARCLWFSYQANTIAAGGTHY
jgi:hypothetical protein